MSEYGVWSQTEDGFVERGFYSLVTAEQAATDSATDGDTLTARQLCDEHTDEEQPADGCELCLIEASA